MCKMRNQDVVTEAGDTAIQRLKKSWKWMPLGNGTFEGDSRLQFIFICVTSHACRILIKKI